MDIILKSTLQGYVATLYGRSDVEGNGKSIAEAIGILMINLSRIPGSHVMITTREG